MTQPSNWLWGLVPLTLLWSAATTVMVDPIERDIAMRATASASTVAGQVPGAKAVSADVQGRDVALGGEALTTDGAARALAQLRTTFGVRRVTGALSQVVAQKPYGWSASHDGKAVQLDGFVPDEATAEANKIAAATAFPGLRVDDRQVLAFGAPIGFAEMTRALLAELPRLAQGKVALDDLRFCVEGKAVSSDAFLALGEGAAFQGQPGFQRVDCSLEPPTVAPYRWSAQQTPEGGLIVEGFYPDAATRGRIAELAGRAAGTPARLDDRSKPALGAPSAFLAKVTRALDELAALRNGRVALDGETYAITGEGPRDHAACEALRLRIAQLDGPDSTAVATIDCPPAPPPPAAMPDLPEIPALFVPPELLVQATPAPSPPQVPAPLPTPLPTPTPAAPRPLVGLSWQAQKTPGQLALSGLVRDEASKAALLSRAPDAATDGLRIEPELKDEPGYAAATGFALEILERMTQGTVTIQGTRLALSGTVADAEAWRAVTAMLAQRALPGGLTFEAGPAPVLAVRPYALSVSVDKSGLSLSGYLPDAQAKAEIQALVAASPLQGRLSDDTVLVPGAPSQFGPAARAAVVNLLRLDLGAATLDESGLQLRGLTCRELIRSEVETGIASGLPEGVVGTALVGLRQTGCVVDPPNTCQNDLDALTQRNAVLFSQGAAIVTLDPVTERVIDEAVAILKQCPAARITIEGHANADGERAGFDNVGLSNRRAERVRAEMVQRGIAAAQLDAKGFGTLRPLVAHGQPDAKAKNRRVQFTVAK